MERQWKLSSLEMTQAIANYVQQANGLPCGTQYRTEMRAWTDASGGERMEATVTVVEKPSKSTTD